MNIPINDFCDRVQLYITYIYFYNICINTYFSLIHYIHIRYNYFLHRACKIYIETADFTCESEVEFVKGQVIFVYTFYKSIHTQYENPHKRKTNSKNIYFSVCPTSTTTENTL